MQLITVFQTLNSAEAQLVSARLEAAGFPVHVAHELSSLTVDGYSSMATGGILVQVPDERAEEARKFITSSEAASE
jgi:hypothetical protein